MSNNILEVLKTNECDGLLLTSTTNMQYFTGFTGSTGKALLTKEGKYFFTDFRYVTQSNEQCVGFEVVEVKTDYSYTDAINEKIAQENIKVIGFEGDNVLFDDYTQLSSKLNCELKSISLINARIIKTEAELAKISEACRMVDAAFDYVVKNAKPLMTEKEIEIMIKTFLLQNNAQGFSFDPIVASGPRGALPHGAPTNRVVQPGDFVTTDFGALFEGYCSDITRTFAFGPNPNPKVAEIYEVVLKAQLAAIDAARPGITGADLDKVARDIITEAGYGANFGHGLGHGLGLLVHEAPGVSALSTTVLEPGMVITIEPGIYIPEVGGVRIEDDILITEDGCVVLTKADKDLKII